MPAKYVHLSGRDIDNAYDELHGLTPVDEEEAEETVQKCPRCEELNEPDDRFCSRCGQALAIDAAEELEQAKAKVTDVASDTDAALTMQLVEAIREDKEEVVAFIEQIE